MSSKAGRVIFVGNIPYGLTEEQVIHIFGQVGTVLNFRLVYDKDTGKPKGFGFAEFADADTASAAVRNLNDYEIMGRRLRVDYSNEGGSGDHAPSNYKDQPQHGQQNSLDGSQQLPAQPPPHSQMPPLPQGVDLPPNLSCPDAISRTLSSLPPPQLLDILSQMKGLVSSDPLKATELLRQAPQLSYAIFQALLLLGLVDTSVLATVVDQAQQSVQQQAPPPQPPQITQPQYAQQPYLAQPQHPQYPPHLQHLAPGGVPTPPPPVQHYQPPQMQQQQAPPAVDAQQALIQQILAMSQQQVDALPPPERAQIMMVRQQLRGAGYAF